MYESLEGYDVPGVLFGSASKVEGPSYLDDDALRLQVLLPDDLSFDMAVNIFTYDPGGHLPMVETRVMEHGLLYLQGQGIYMLDHEWHPIKKRRFHLDGALLPAIIYGDGKGTCCLYLL